MTERYILEALQKAVMAAVAASTSPTLPVKYLGRNFTPPSAGKWLEVVYIPNNILNEFWAEGKTYRGMLRLILHWPMNDTGAYSAMDLINSITSYFTKGLRLVDAGNNAVVRITDNPNLMNVLEEPPELILPVSIRYNCFKPA